MVCPFATCFFGFPVVAAISPCRPQAPHPPKPRRRSVRLPTESQFPSHPARGWFSVFVVLFVRRGFHSPVLASSALPTHMKNKNPSLLGYGGLDGPLLFHKGFAGVRDTISSLIYEVIFLQTVVITFVFYGLPVTTPLFFRVTLPGFKFPLPTKKIPSPQSLWLQYFSFLPLGEDGGLSLAKPQIFFFREGFSVF